MRSLATSWQSRRVGGRGLASVTHEHSVSEWRARGISRARNEHAEKTHSEASCTLRALSLARSMTAA